MQRKVILSFLAVMLVAVASTAAYAAGLESIGHKYFMRGQILDVSGKMVYLCIGSSEGAKVGQEYSVVKFVRVANPNQAKSPAPTFKREDVGVVKITKIVDEHMAHAKIVSGAAKVNYMVELK